MTSAIILAGGLGTRLRSAVPDLPKPMAPVSGRPFLEILMDYWIGQGVDQFILSVGYRYEAILDYFGTGYKNAKLEYAIETSPLGTGGGVLLAMQKVSDKLPFLLLNGDTFFAVDFAQLKRFAEHKKADICFSLFRTAETGRYMGMEVAPDGRIVSLKSGDGTPGRLANGGVYWISPQAIRSLGFSNDSKISLEDDLFTKAHCIGKKLVGLEFSGTFIDIGIPCDYTRAATLFPNGGL